MICVEEVKGSNETLTYKSVVEAKGHAVQSGVFIDRVNAEAWAQKTMRDILTRDLIVACSPTT